MPSAEQPPLTDEAVGLPGQVREVREILRSRGVRYPLESRSAFVTQMSETPGPVRYGGQYYEVGFVSNLVPDFLFPVLSEQDMLAKVTELLVSRGRLPLDALRSQR